MTVSRAILDTRTTIHFDNYIFKIHFLYPKSWYFEISQNFVPNAPTNKKSAFVQMMAWCQTGEQESHEPMAIVDIVTQLLSTEKSAWHIIDRYIYIICKSWYWNVAQSAVHSLIHVLTVPSTILPWSSKYTRCRVVWHFTDPYYMMWYCFLWKACIREREPYP